MSSESEKVPVKRRQPARCRRYLAVLVATVSVVPIFSGCSEEEEREYVVPQSLCGMPVDVDALVPFFPPGRKVAVHPESVKGEKQCQVKVDGLAALTITQAWREKGEGITNYALSMTADPLEHQSDDDRYLYSDTQGFGRTEGCVDSVSEEELYTGVQAFSKKHKDADTMKRVIVAFTEAVQGSTACKEGPSELEKTP